MNKIVQENFIVPKSKSEKWIEDHRTIYVFMIGSLGLMLGFLSSLFFGAPKAQGLMMGFVYSFRFITTDMSVGGKD